MKRLDRYKYNLVLGLFLLASVVQSLPNLHHHNQSHPCHEQNGHYYYLVVNSQHTTSEGPCLQGLVVGRGHEHESCSFCHPLTLGFLSQLAYAFALVQNAVPCQLADPDFERHLETTRSRGPPARLS